MDSSCCCVCVCERLSLSPQTPRLSLVASATGRLASCPSRQSLGVRGAGGEGVRGARGEGGSGRPGEVCEGGGAGVGEEDMVKMVEERALASLGEL